MLWRVVDDSNLRPACVVFVPMRFDPVLVRFQRFVELGAQRVDRVHEEHGYVLGSGWWMVGGGWSNASLMTSQCVPHITRPLPA